LVSSPKFNPRRESTAALYRLGHGDFSMSKESRAGVYEYKIDLGPGYRIYFGKDGDRIVILLGGSDKKHQGIAISNAQTAWARHKKHMTADRD
jgi:putative addiction module killer protein